MRARCTHTGWLALSLLACTAPQAVAAATGTVAVASPTGSILSDLYWGLGISALAFAGIGWLIPGRKAWTLAAFQRKKTKKTVAGDDGERVAALASATFEAIIIHRDGIVIDGNPQLAKLLGRSPKDLPGTSIYDFLRDGPDIDVATVTTFNDDTIHELVLVASNGERIPVQARGRDILYHGQRARVGCFVDLRERKEAEQRIRHLAQHDVLTGLPNRALFAERVAELSARGASFAIAMVDIDRFKDVNDGHGHHAGDTVIRETAARLQRLLGPHDLVARLGGDEFAVILANTHFSFQIEDFGHRLLASMVEPIEIATGERLQLDVSIGGALCPEHAAHLDGLVGKADIALFHAKQQGRGASLVFRPGMNEAIEKRRALEADLDLAIARGEFELYLQPRVNAVTADVVAYEALLRWNHPQRGLVSPGEFIPVAEASGQIVALGEWVIAEACRLSHGLEGRRISVNVSPLQFRASRFLVRLGEMLKETGTQASQIELEITESVLIDDDKRALQVLDELKRMGFDVALDDFGTGYSSLSYLSRYPFDTIKIDRSFVSNLGVVDSAQVIVRSIIALGNGLGMQIVAEGVETIEEALFLTQAGCDELQGYLLGRPVPVGDRLTEVRPAIGMQLKGMAEAAHRGKNTHAAQVVELEREAV
ncbi:EAL domain-containing protein [Rhizobiales bacterium RZME27]|uniref:EAL domain-containing protein n=1 Tax=Endobacterium cereale TaxID=2663029 RepID=A0A6A8ADV5_9HYPH|nr:GGDEF and EAL domain-containing protein [Endobacterium cereale]MEB2843883.1 EAL domain-containing protein [Endobacterium cereale]MQY49493.1 EAL domain-containing protein [Endobacterium cereale]